MQVPTELGIVDVRSIREKTTDEKDRGTYVKWKDEDRFIIGDYAHKNSNSAALRKFRSRFPGLKESTIRSFKARVVGNKRCFERKTCSCAIIAKIFFKNRPSPHAWRN